jgi:DNA-binding MarR family transcriptional regulator
MVDKTLRSQTVQAWQEHRPDLDTSAMEIVALINTITAALDHAVEQAYEGSGLTSADMGLLVPLRYSADLVTAARLAERLNMSRAGVSKTLTRLEKRGILERRPHPTDRRSATVQLTKHGKDLVDELFPRELHAHSELLSNLGRDRDRIVESLALLTAAVHTASGSGNHRDSAQVIDTTNATPDRVA